MGHNDIISVLTEQPFPKTVEDNAILEEFKQMAAVQAKTDNSIAVLTDYSKNCSYIYSGNFGVLFGLKPGVEFIFSAFEDVIFDKIAQKDLEERNRLELEYFTFIRNTPIEERSKYNAISFLNIAKNDGSSVDVLHKTFYVKSFPNGSVWLALCLYSPSVHQVSRDNINGKIINNETAEVLFSLDSPVENIVLGKREIEVLRLIAKGAKSKDVANSLNVSVHTVYRHRQNIIDKLAVSNATEAVNKALVNGMI